LGEEFQMQIDATTTTVGDLKDQLSSKYKIGRRWIRVREVKAGQFREILGNTESLMKVK
jgi:hypothetical protein